MGNLGLGLAKPPAGAGVCPHVVPSLSILHQVIVQSLIVHLELLIPIIRMQTKKTETLKLKANDVFVIKIVIAHHIIGKSFKGTTIYE